MQVPIGWIKRYFDMRDDAGLFIDFGEQCQTIGTNAFYPRHMMIGRAQPPHGFLDDRKSPRIRQWSGFRDGSGDPRVGHRCPTAKIDRIKVA